MARVLLVEDHPDVHDLLCNVLRQLGHKADCVRTAALARMALAPGAYDLVICNVGLPDGSGRDIAALARAAGIKAVLTSGHPNALQALNAAGVEHLAKPFRIPTLIETIERQLA
jgi:DNA-binding response OmpR family regulator